MIYNNIYINIYNTTYNTLHINIDKNWRGSFIPLPINEDDNEVGVAAQDTNMKSINNSDNSMSVLKNMTKRLRYVNIYDNIKYARDPKPLVYILYIYNIILHKILHNMIAYDVCI